MNRPNLRIEFRVIPASEQRYPTCGDYWFDENGVWQFRVSRMGNLFYEILVLIHELTEWAMCEVIGIQEPDIKKFDEMFEAERAAGLWKDEEAGHDPRAPYGYQHKCAEKVERLAAELMKVDWGTYSNAVESL